MAPSTPRAAAAGGTTAAAKREQARRATADGPPAGFAPVEPDPAPVDEPPAQQQARPVPSTGRAPLLAGGPDWGDGGGFLFGLLAYTLTLAYIRHGKAGVIGWLKAKMINEPTQFPSEPVPGSLSRHDVTA